MITNHGVAVNMNKTRKCHSAYASFRNMFGNVYNANNLKNKFLTRNKNGAGCQGYVGGGRKSRKSKSKSKSRKGTRRHR